MAELLFNDIVSMSDGERETADILKEGLLVPFQSSYSEIASPTARPKSVSTALPIC